MFAVILLSLLLVAAVALVWYLKHRNEYFQRLGIPGPKPALIVGNLLEFANELPHLVLERWTKEFGSTYGYYEGGTPVLITTDLDLLHEIFIKQFSSFHTRKGLPAHPDSNQDEEVGLFNANGFRWKRLRLIVNPAFSTAKLKLMTESMNDATKLLVSIMREKCHPSGSVHNVQPFYQGLSMDIICRTSFGFVSPCQRNPNDPFMKYCLGVLQNLAKLRWFEYGAVMFPELDRMFYYYAQLTRHWREDANTMLITKLEEALRVVEASRSERPANLLHFLLNAEQVKMVQDVESDASMSMESESEMWSAANFAKKMRKEEVYKQGITFMIAGFEAASTVLSYTTHLLALHDDVQTKLQREVDARMQKVSNEALTFEDLARFPFTDMVVHEVLRLYPIASPVTARKCVKDCYVADVHIPQGLTVAADVWSIHTDPRHWGDRPEEFDPDRFLPDRVADRHPLAYLPFGAGPRNCIGIRFAMMELKIILIHLVHNFRFERCAQTEVPLKLLEGVNIMPQNGVSVLVQCRTH